MRLDGPLVNSLGRETTTETTLVGQYIPAGVPILLDIHTTHRDPKSWENAYTFDPDRYNIKTEAERNSTANGLVWTPFGHGPHKCLGLNFSLVEQRVILSMLCKSTSSLAEVEQY